LFNTNVKFAGGATLLSLLIVPPLKETVPVPVNTRSTNCDPLGIPVIVLPPGMLNVALLLVGGGPLGLQLPGLLHKLLPAPPVQVYVAITKLLKSRDPSAN
jgi:hypothetical protein